MNMVADLNPEQMLAVNHIDGPLLVLAGAGSGKTRVVTRRISHLLNIGVPASDILALTFTNKAAEEMKRRVRQESNQNVLISTFHSLGARILRESSTEIGYKTDFTIYDQKDSDQLLKNCLQILGIKDEKGLLRTLRSSISEAKNALVSPDDAGYFSDAQRGKLLQDIYALYQSKLKEYNALDFDDLLFLTVKLFQNSQKARELYQNRWSFLLIDEYQDTNKAQYTLTKYLVEKHNNLFVVGDPDQSIYSWRGANLENILNFENDFETAKVITLEQNYRSTSIILQGANALIQNNLSRYEKKLWSDLGAGESIGTYVAKNDHDEAHFIIEKIFHHQRNDSVPFDEVAIFYRTNSQSRIFEDHLLRQNIPYVIIGGLSFYQRREIKDILALLRLSISEADFLSFARSINTPRRGFGEKALSNLHDLAEELHLPIIHLCERILENPHAYETIKLSKKQKSGLSEYIDTLSTIKNMQQTGASIDEIIMTAVEKSGYLNFLKEDQETYSERKENLDELINKGLEWQNETIDPKLVNFLEELSLKSSHEEKNNPHSIKLMTLHNGKGLEFLLTFIVGMEEDLFPHINSKDSPDSLEEERRLCYVGMTRARKYLYLTASNYRMIWGTPKFMRPSRFFEEIPEEYTFSYNKKPEMISEDSDMPGEMSALQNGTAVFHKDFGKGVIKKSFQTSLGLTYDVYFFENNVTRSLVAKFAKFEIC